MTSGRKGFTLLELLVALTLLAVVVLMGRGLAESVLDGSRRVSEHRRQLDSEMNAVRWLAGAFLAAEASSTEDGRFEGDSIQVAFRTFLPSAGGWKEPARVRIGVQQGQLVAEGPQGALSLRSASRLDLDYLAEPGASGAWLRGWKSRSGVPYAIRLRIQRHPGTSRVDTLLLLMRRRG